MKKLFQLLTILFILLLKTNAQVPQLWGMTNWGGTNNLGAIIRLNADGSALQSVYSFGTMPNTSPGSHPQNDLFQASDGKLYGMTFDGGLYNYGVIFSFDISTNTFIKLYDFNDSTGGNPMGALVQADNGKLYGLGSSGGTLGFGVIFSFDITSNTYSDLYNFNTGQNSYWNPNVMGSLIKVPNGKLYGLTCYGGATNVGSIFSFDPATNIFSQIRTLSTFYGTNPYGSLFRASDGQLYFTTPNETICSYNISSNFLNLRGHITGGSQGNLVQISNGFLFGMSYDNTIFAFNPVDDSCDAIYTFTDSVSNYNHYYSQGGTLGKSLFYANDGKLYGMAQYGGANNYGTIFSYNPVNNSFGKLYDFNDSSGANPMGAFIQANNGKLYGMTKSGGAWNDGVIFGFDPVQNSYSKLFDFKEYYSADGANPTANLVRANSGLLYGMTPKGGNDNAGALFSFNATNNNFIKLHDFNIQDGAAPNGSLIQAADGNLYGMTLLGGPDTNHYTDVYYNQFLIAGSGAMFKFDIGTNTYTVLHIFNDTAGRNPYGSLLQSGNGKLYGMTSKGGTYNAGVIFTYDIPTNTYKIIHNFNDTSGSNPYGNLMEGNDGKLYGMTLNGGIYSFSDGRCGDFGVIFSLDTATNNFHVLQYFNTGNAIAQRPFGSLMQAASGKLYAMTSGSSAGIYQVDNCSVWSGNNIFSLDISATTFTDLYDFNYAFGGYNPMGSLMQSSNGKFYGMVPQGGSNQMGVVFSFDTANNYTVLHNFYGYNGAYPQGDLIELPQGTGLNELNKPNELITIYPNPFSDYSTLTINGNLSNMNSCLIIYDITGREIRNISIDNKKRIIIDRDHLESGMYFYKLLSGEREIMASGKLIIY